MFTVGSQKFVNGLQSKAANVFGPAAEVVLLVLMKPNSCTASLVLLNRAPTEKIGRCMISPELGGTDLELKHSTMACRQRATCMPPSSLVASHGALPELKIATTRQLERIARWLASQQNA